MGLIGGNNRARTCDPLLVRQVLSQLSYAPKAKTPAINGEHYFTIITAPCQHFFHKLFKNIKFLKSSEGKKPRNREFQKKQPPYWTAVCVGVYLFSRAVASQVFSARVSLTSVFGMGTGGPSPLRTPTDILSPSSDENYYNISF